MNHERQPTTTTNTFNPSRRPKERQARKYASAMFLPENVGLYEKEEKERKQALQRIEVWGKEMIPQELRADADIAVREMACGDPNCSPVDTVITIFFEKGVDGIFGIPMMAKEITMKELKVFFPTEEVLHKWSRGENVEWPPPENNGLTALLPQDMPKLRFEVGTRVLCRTGPDAEKDWSRGTVILQWYRDSKWPMGSYAPYKIRLDDDREIYAPADMDQVIKKDELDAPAASE